MKTNKASRTARLSTFFALLLCGVATAFWATPGTSNAAPGNYPNTAAQLGANTTVTPDAAPTNTNSINVSTSTDFKGKLEGDPTTGIVRVTDAHPSGTYTVTVIAFDSGGVATTKMFALTVTTVAACNSISFAGAASFGTGAHPYSVAVGDFNGDGKQDLAVANFDSNNVSILLGDGVGNFSAANNFGVGFQPGSVAVGDFNGDGRQDLAVANIGSDDVSILLGNGAGTFGPPMNFKVGGDPFSVAVGDFNGDGRQDLAVANSDSQNVSVLLGDGKGSFSPAANPAAKLAAGSRPRSVAVGDFNGDHKQDLAVANILSNDVSVVLGNGAGGFSLSATLPVGQNPTSVAVADLDGDGKQDLIVANASSNSVSVFLGNGAGGFGPAVNFQVGRNPSSVAVGDFNSDGRLDLATANYSGNNDVSVLLQQCLPPTGGFGRLSTRALVQTGNNVLVSGFTITGNAPRKMLVRALGPSLKVNGQPIPTRLQDPTLELRDGNGNLITFNDNWKDMQQAEIEATGQAPPNDLESAIVGTISPGNYITIVRGQNNTTGIGMADIIDLDTSTDSQLGRISSGALVQTGDNVVLGGFTINGPQSQKVIIRGLGPSLGASGMPVPGALQDPTLQLRDSSGNRLVCNDNWKDSSQQTEIQATGLAPADDRESAILATLAPGAYTAVLAGTNNTTGRAVVEVYNLGLTGNATKIPPSSSGPCGTPPGQLQFTSATYSVNENGGSATITITRAAGSDGAVSVDYATSDGTATAGQDYTASSGTLNFANGETSMTFTVPILDDTLDEPDETVTLTLSNPKGGAILGMPSTATLTILDNDPPPALSINNVMVLEGNSGTTNAVFTVTLSVASGRTVTVQYATVDRTATAGSDYVATSGMLTFDPGQTSQTIPVVVNGDTISERDETFTVHLSNATNATIAVGDGTGTIINDDPAPPAQLLNISTRAQVQMGEKVLIGGFIITGTQPKKVIVRAIGPSLKVPGAMQDPTLELRDQEGMAVTNDNWKTDDHTHQSQQAEIEATGIAPADDRESALVKTLDPGNYTVVLLGKNNTEGIAVVEAYDLDSSTTAQLANISSRGFVQIGDNVLIGGFVAGPFNAANTRVVVRGIGPSLARAGLTNVLADPTLELRNSNGDVIASNDDWKDGPDAQEIKLKGLAPTDNRESALLAATLRPGSYTAIVRGNNNTTNNTTGIGLVEIYNLKPTSSGINAEAVPR